MYTTFFMNMVKKIEFTDEALKQIKKIVLEKGSNKYFRISVEGGGCSGFKYNFSFDSKIEKDDIVFDKTIIDKNSLNIINGSVVDHYKVNGGEHVWFMTEDINSSELTWEFFSHYDLNGFID